MKKYLVLPALALLVLLFNSACEGINLEPENDPNLVFKESCNAESNLFADPAMEEYPFKMTFRNETTQYYKLYKLDESGNRVWIKDLFYGSSITIDTYIFQPFVITSYVDDVCQFISVPVSGTEGEYVFKE